MAPHDATLTRGFARAVPPISRGKNVSQIVAVYTNDWIPRRTLVPSRTRLQHGRDFIAGGSVHRTAAVILPSVAWMVTAPCPPGTLFDLFFASLANLRTQNRRPFCLGHELRSLIRRNRF